MKKSLISDLLPKAKEKLFDNINYMMVKELQDFCDKHSIPYYIHYKCKGKAVKTRELDRKGIVIGRIKHYLETAEIKSKTVFPESVVCFDTLPSPLKPTHPVYYGQYKNKNDKILKLLKSLTNNKFEFGAIAQEIIRQCWTDGKAPTYQEFAESWTRAVIEHTQPNSEWAFLLDRKNGVAGKDWKEVRIKNANEAIAYLNKITFTPNY